MALSLYTWQQTCIAKWMKLQGRGIVQVVTGAGKTILALYAAKALQGILAQQLHIVVIVPKTFLVGQWKASILAHQKDLGIGREDIGWVHGGHHQDHDKPVMIYVVNSARYTLARILQEKLASHTPVLIIADECHHYASRENRKLFAFLETLSAEEQQYYFALGLSATPKVNGFEQHLVPVLGPLFYTYGFAQAIDDNVINKVVIYNIALQMSERQAEKYEELSAHITNTLHRLLRLAPYLKRLSGPAFFAEVQELCLDPSPSLAHTANLLLTLLHQRRALVSQASQRHHCVLDLIRLLDPASKIIIFGERIGQSETLYTELNRRYPNKVCQYHSDLGDTERTLALQRYRNGEARILVSCKALDEGLDIPSADVGIVMASTSEQRQRIQRLGRILRRQEGKGRASLFYLSLDQTIEDSELLDQGIETVEEWYLSYSNHFIHPVYDDLADTLYTAMQRNKADLRGIDRILDQGRIRNDWFEDPKLLQDKQEKTHNPQLQRYYTCMRSLSLLREKG